MKAKWGKDKKQIEKNWKAKENTLNVTPTSSERSWSHLHV
jgi:hypothetical protein